ncbi:uncharacterized protein LOC127846063 [Dreissena polymorpha]|nr:uncharacterized protein LOC127843588 [Dreissena polymorpha]XP_052233200.1 uncharacterized protein LOC127846063 [Dreissena polymorpha]
MITPLRIQWEVTKRGTTLCVAECSNDPECNSVFYNKVTKKCQGHSVTFGLLDNHMTGQSDTRYYVPFRGHGYILDACTVDADCTIPNSTCWDSRQCMCKPGYSFSPSSRQCVYPCSQFGPLFMTYADSFVHANNLETINNIPLEDCFNLCRNKISFTCRAVEYMGNNCILSNVTAKDTGTTFARDTLREYNVSYHQRDCA